MYNILVIDDSALVRKFMCDIISSLDGFSASADKSADGESAYNSIRKGKYDCVVMSMTMQSADGIKILEMLKKDKNKTPVIAIGSAIREDRDLAVKAMDLGAIGFVVRPIKFKGLEKENFVNQLTEALKSGVKGKKHMSFADFTDSHKSLFSLSKRKNFRDFDLVAVASSTGGPQALLTLVSGLPKHIGVPVVIVQHMPEGFTESLAQRINSRSKLLVKEAKDEEILEPDVVYIAKGGRHLQVVEKIKGQRMLRVYNDEPVNNLKPCADVMFESLKKCSFKHILCVVLTGMGSDGCEGIRSLRKKKNLYVVAQNEESCVVYGMPKAIYEAGEVDETAHISEMAKSITKELGV